MQKKKLIIIFSAVIFFGLFGLAKSSMAANWYVRPSGGSGSGTSWTAAWNGLGAINWSTVSCGDTIWVAGGSYGWMQPTTKTCTSGSQLYIRRARSDASACTGSSGWSSGYDSTVLQDNGVIAFNPGTYNYITISGRTTSSGGGYGWRIYNHQSEVQAPNGVYGIIMWNESILNYLTVEYMDIEGPNRAFYNDTWGAGGIRVSSWVAGSSHYTFSHLKIHGWDTGIFAINADYYLMEYIDMYDISNNGGDLHPNLMYIKSGNYGVIKYSSFHNSQASGTGIAFSDGGPYADWQIYGNKFYDMNTWDAAAIGVQSDIGHGGNGTITGLKIYNNTFSNNVFNINNSGTCGTGCETKNNIFHGSGGVIYCGTMSNNLITSDDSIFVNRSAQDLHIVSTTGSGYPRNAGTSLSSYFTADMDGTAFGADGTWDVGAYEYTSGGGGDTTAPVAPSGLAVN